MLWLIQRDFLEGKTVQQMVSEALAPVSNPSRDPDIAQVGGSYPHHAYMTDSRDMLLAHATG